MTNSTTGTETRTSRDMGSPWDKILITGQAAACPGLPEINLPLFSQIKDNLWTGGSVAEYRDIPMHPQFDSVLNLYPWMKYETIYIPNYLDLRMMDSYQVQKQVDSIMIGVEFIAMNIDQGPLLVHCQAGVNRSNLVAAMYLRSTGMTSDEAIALIRKNRGPVALCNPAFEDYLRRLDG